ncbi:MAG TPA: HepT-like ribonuclease domain-containing protein [Syntrophales bacterium]|nr:HepT-like ribonuclease domain-containing protein [Syntrophales bacterium]
MKLSVKRPNGFPTEYKKKYPTVPWRSLAGFRDVLIHQYEGVSLAEIWQIVEKDLEPLRQAITAILPPLEELERQLAGDDMPDGE